ncbi:MAG TPA: molybdopterin cofactor-binding domain-containing protein, partial [Methylophilus sp.]
MNDMINLSRRSFIKNTALVAGGLVVAFSIPQAKRFMGVANAAEAMPLPAPNAFLRIGTDDSITVMLAHSEMGQGVWTTLPMLIADELDADWNTVKVEHAPAAPAYIHTAYGIQITGGSSTTWSEFDRYRQAGALTRALLMQAAAKQWNVPVAGLRTENGAVINGSQKLRYGQLVETASQLPTPASVTLKKPEEWKFIGKATKRLDSAEKINGTAKFGQDVQFDGLKIAMVARVPVFGTTLKSVDDSAALKVPGVIKVVKVPTGVAVIAEHYWAAKQGREALKVEWDVAGHDKPDSAALLKQYQALAQQPGLQAAKAGDIASASKQAAQTVSAEYVLPYLSHAPMEPLNCAVKISDQGCEIWTGTQMQTTDQASAAKILGLKPEQVKIHTQFLGGGFGRRANPRADFVSEAVQVAQAAGLPVK